MTRRVTLGILLVIALSFSALAAEIPVILPPNTTAYTVTEVAALTVGIATLREVLSDYAHGSYRYFDPTDWMSFDFAAYTAGTLAGRGYETRLVKGEGWVDGEHTWVIVGIPLAGQVAWVPVEASPGLGKRQSILGTIPSFTDGTGAMWFENVYTSFAAEVPLSANLPPIATMTCHPFLGNNRTGSDLPRSHLPRSGWRDHPLQVGSWRTVDLRSCNRSVHLYGSWNVHDLPHRHR